MLSQGDLSQAASIAVQLVNTALQVIEDLKNTSLAVDKKLALINQLQEIEQRLEELTKTLQAGLPFGQEPMAATAPSPASPTKKHKFL